MYWCIFFIHEKPDTDRASCIPENNSCITVFVTVKYTPNTLDKTGPQYSQLWIYTILGFQTFSVDSNDNHTIRAAQSSPDQLPPSVREIVVVDSVSLVFVWSGPGVDVWW